MLEIKNITKRYGSHIVLDHINLTFEHGIYGLLGENGAGKTTLLSIVMGILQAEAGSILYDGRTVTDKDKAYYGNIGFMPQYATFYPEFTAEEFLKYMCVLKGIPKRQQKARIGELLTQVNLLSDARKKLRTFSGGMRQRVGIAQALLNRPEILILDEPTAGLDPMERIRFRNLISDISKNRIVILATHIVQDIEYTADHVILLHEGKVSVQGSPGELKEKIRGERTHLADAENREPNLEDVFLFYALSKEENCGADC